MAPCLEDEAFSEELEQEGEGTDVFEYLGQTAEGLKEGLGLEHCGLEGGLEVGLEGGEGCGQTKCAGS